MSSFFLYRFLLEKNVWHIITALFYVLFLVSNFVAASIIAKQLHYSDLLQDPVEEQVPEADIPGIVI